MKKTLFAIILSLFTCVIFAQNATPSVDSVKTEIIETDSTVSIKSVQVTTVQVTSQRIAQEIERYKYEEKQLEDKLKQVRNQLKEFERLMGGIIVTEKRIEKKKADAEKAKEDAEKKKGDKPSAPPAQSVLQNQTTNQKKN